MNLTALSAVANSVRSLTIDAVEKAKSGHPGLPMGCAELGALVYGEFLSHWPQDPALDQPGPLCPFGRARLHAPVLPPAPLGVRPVPRRHQELPPAGIKDPGSSRSGGTPPAWRPRRVRWDRDLPTALEWRSRSGSSRRSSIPPRERSSTITRTSWPATVT